MPWSLLDELYVQTYADQGGTYERRRQATSRKRVIQKLRDHFLINTALWNDETLFSREEQLIGFDGVTSPTSKDGTRRFGTATVAELGDGRQFELVRQLARIGDGTVSGIWKDSAKTDLGKVCRQIVRALLVGLGGGTLEDSSDPIAPMSDFVRNAQLPNSGSQIHKGTTNVFRPNMRAHDSSLRRIQHGDLNARNITWSTTHQAFFLIDFEHVTPGLLGGDQFKLVASILTELPSHTLLGRTFHRDIEVERSVVQALTVLAKLAHKLASPLPDQANWWRLNTAVDPKDRFLSRVVLEIVRCSEFPIQAGRLEPDFVSYLMFCYFYKQMEYGFRGLHEAHLHDLRRVADSLKEWRSSVEPLPEALPSSLRDREVLMFAYSFYAGLLLFDGIERGMTGEAAASSS